MDKNQTGNSLKKWLITSTSLFLGSFVLFFLTAFISPVARILIPLAILIFVWITVSQISPIKTKVGYAIGVTILFLILLFLQQTAITVAGILILVVLRIVYRNKIEQGEVIVATVPESYSGIKRTVFYPILILAGVFLPFIFTGIACAHTNCGEEFGGIAIFFFGAAISVLVMIIIAIAYEIIRKKEKDGSPYVAANHPAVNLIVGIVAVVILFLICWSTYWYLKPIFIHFGYYQQAGLIRNTSFADIDLSTYSIKDVLINNYFVIRSIIIVLTLITLYSSITKKKYARLWLLATIVAVIIMSWISRGIFDPVTYTPDNANYAYRETRDLGDFLILYKAESTHDKAICDELIPDESTNGIVTQCTYFFESGK